MQVACGLGVCGRYMFILELSDSEHEPKVSAASETGDITSELLPPRWKPLTNLSHHHLHRGPAELSLAPRHGWGRVGEVGAWPCPQELNSWRLVKADAVWGSPITLTTGSR